MRRCGSLPTTSPTSRVPRRRGRPRVDPGWIQLWSADEVLAHNEGYCVGESLSGCFAFATNGGGEIIVFDARGTERYPVLMVPFIPMEIESAVRIAGSFAELQAQLGVPSSETA